MKLTEAGADESMVPTGPQALFEYDFLRCRECGTLVTRPEAEAAMNADGVFCKCGSRQIKPTNPLWYEFLKLSVIRWAGLPTAAWYAFKALVGLW